MECDKEDCGFDGGDCVTARQGFCNSGCFEDMLGDGVCQEACLTARCENDRGDCESQVCSTGCFPYMVGDGKCQESCHVETCEWDRADCDCLRAVILN